MIKYYRTAYFVGAIVHFGTAGILLEPKALIEELGLSNMRPELGMMAASYMAGFFLIGWAAVLIWGGIKPIERKDLLLVTAFPVSTGLVTSIYYSMTEWSRPFSVAIHMWLPQIILSIIYIITYCKVLKSIKEESRHAKQ